MTPSYLLYGHNPYLPLFLNSLTPQNGIDLHVDTYKGEVKASTSYQPLPQPLEGSC